MSYIGKTPTPIPLTSSDITDGIITTTKIADDAATADKIANAVNSEITANTAKTGISSSQTSAITANTSKTTNATHSGEVTGSGALTIADNIVDEANLKVSNSPTNGYFLAAQSGNTGGLTWQEAGGGGKIGQVVQTVKTTTFSTSSNSYTDVTGMSVAITPSATSSKVLVTVQFTAGATSGYKFYTTLLKGSTEIYRGNADGNRQRDSYGGKANANDDTRSVSLTFLDSPSTTSATTYKLQGKIEPGSGVFYVNMSKSSNDTNNSVYGRSASSITVMEVLA